MTIIRAGLASRLPHRAILLVVFAATLGACSGGGGGGSTSSSGSAFLPQAQVRAMCAAPRPGTDPYNKNLPYPDKQGTLRNEQDWLASWTNDWYLWYSEVSYGNPASYATAIDYFNVLKTNAVTASGKPKDKPREHFTYSTAVYEALSNGGVSVGYGVTWALLSATPPRSAVVAYTEPNSPASLATPALVRGAQVLFVDGVDLVNVNTQAGVDTLNAGMWPTAAGTHTFVLSDAAHPTGYTVSLTAQAVTSQPVQNVGTIPGTGNPGVGYILFNDHIRSAEPELFNAITALKGQGVTDLVLDLRYNLGGYLDIASELAYMIAAPAKTAGRTFELIHFNSKYPNYDPIAKAAITPIPFQPTTVGFDPSIKAGTPLPNLNLTRVFVITGSDTASASEAIMNSLAGVGVQVIQIGSTTFGKPYGFYPQDNCGTTYFSIQFQGVNAQGFGDYGDGFSPQNSTLAVPGSAATLPGCQVADDFTHALGDPAEARLAAALAWRAGGGNAACPMPPSGLVQPRQMQSLAAAEGHVVKPLFLRNRILRPRPGP